MAVRLERAHAQFFGQNQSLLVVVCGKIAIRRLAPHSKLAMEI